MAWLYMKHTDSAKLWGRAGKPLDAAEVGGVLAAQPAGSSPCSAGRRRRGTVLLTEIHSSLKNTF